MERRSGGIHQTACLREGSRSAFVHVVPDHLGVATPLDQDALHRVLPVVRGFTVVPRGARQVVRHHLLLSCSDRIRASFLVV